jgi:hypothetical protein
MRQIARHERFPLATATLEEAMSTQPHSATYAKEQTQS